MIIYIKRMVFKNGWKKTVKKSQVHNSLLSIPDDEETKHELIGEPIETAHRSSSVGHAARVAGIRS
jgi:hypothetical protein